MDSIKKNRYNREKGLKTQVSRGSLSIGNINNRGDNKFLKPKGENEAWH